MVKRMIIENKNIDEGKAFDWGRTAVSYAKYRDIYPQKLYDELYALGVGKKGTNWLDMGTGSGVLPRALADYGANITATDISEEQIREARQLSENIKNINYRVCSAEKLDYPDNSFDVITACQCFFYFNPEVIVPKIKRMLRENGIFIKIWMTYLKGDEIADQSYALVKKVNPQYSGGGAAMKDLKIHYFNNPVENVFSEKIHFTKESWHGRMMASRGVMASMSEEQMKKYEHEHLEMLSKYPEEFTVNHVIFLTYYYM